MMKRVRDIINSNRMKIRQFIPIRMSILLTSISAILSFYVVSNAQADFVKDTAFPASGYAAVAWGDYDNDGDLDVIAERKVYRNDGGSFTLVTTFDWGTGAAVWFDYDNDGDLDLALCGPKDWGVPLWAVLYRNDGNDTFTKIQNLCGCHNNQSGLAAGDYDNDGDLDLAYTGWAGSWPGWTAILRNDDGIFNEDTNQNLPDMQNSNVAWADYDNDGDLDLALGGDEWIATRVYYNDNGVLRYGQDLGPGGFMMYGSFAWGDYDNDGDLDLAIGAATCRIFRNDEGILNQVKEMESSTQYGYSACWGDYDNDSDLDLFAGGNVYRNDNGTFTLIETLENCTGYRAAWGDYDGDGDLDLITSDGIYRNDFVVGVNTKPSPPTIFDRSYTEGVLTLKWEDGSDAETPEDGLYYNVRVGLSPGSNDVISGIYGSPLLGNYLRPKISSTQLGVNFKVTQSATYYWSVQTIDTGLKKSNWSEEQNLYVDATPPAAINDLSASAETIREDVTLSWSATGDDGAVGQTTDGKWRIKYSTDSAYPWQTPPLTDYDIEIPIQNVNPGKAQTCTITTLTSGATYYFHIWQADEMPNWSDISNPAGACVARIPPQAIGDLYASSGLNYGTIDLTWTAPGDDGILGRATGYIVKYSNSQFTDQASFDNATDPHHEEKTSWDVKYEANELPQNSTPVWLFNYGSSNYTEEIINGKLHLTAFSGGAVSYCRDEESMSNAIGTTVEARIKVIEGAEGNVRVVIMDRAKSAELKLYNDKVCIDNVPYYYMNTTDDYHIYRITLKGDERKLYVDNKLRIETTSGGTSTNKQIWIWNIADAEAYFDWVYYTLGGAFAPQYEQSWVPLEPGEKEDRTLEGLTPGTAYYIAIEAVDEGGNQGSLSNTDGNNMAIATEDVTPPATINNLSASSGDKDGEIILAWTAPGDDGTLNNNTNGRYIVKYSANPINTDAKFDGATEFSNSWTPANAGELETHTISGLTPGTLYYFAIKTEDEKPNISGLSNSPYATARDLVPAPPTGVNAIAGDRIIDISWIANAEPDIAGYYVYRATTPGGPYTYKSSLITSTNYRDNVSNLVRYYYVVTAKDYTENESGYSFEVSAEASAPPNFVLVLDDFNDGAKPNNLGGGSGVFENNATCSDSIYNGNQDNVYGREGYSLKLNYNVTNPDSYSGYWSALNGMDLSNYKYVSFWVKGEVGGEIFKVELKNNSASRNKAYVYLTDYLNIGIASHWQKVLIPLRAFANLGDWTNMKEFCITFENSANELHPSGTVYVDDIIFGSLEENMLKLDGFNDKTLPNAFGGDTGVWSVSGPATDPIATLVSDPPGYYKQIHHNYTPTNHAYGGTWDKFFHANLSSIKNGDGHLKFRAKGTAVGKKFNVELKCGSGDANAGEVAKGIWYTIPSNWQEFDLPLSSFNLPTWENMYEFVLVFNDWATQVEGDFYIDDIRFEKSGYEPDTVPPSAPSNLKTNGVLVNKGQVFGVNNILSVRADIGGIDGTLEGVRFEFLIEGTTIWHIIATDYNVSDYDYTALWDTTGLDTVETYSVCAIAQDASGNEATSTTFTGCAVDNTTTPSAITNLSASTGNDDEILLTWTAPGEDGTTGTASSYIVKFATFQFTDQHGFDDAMTHQQEWVPLPAGNREDRTMKGLLAKTTYYVAIEAKNSIGNQGALSNLDNNSAWVDDQTPPAPITDLVVVTGEYGGELNLSWTAPGDNGREGKATAYVVKYSVSQFTDQTSFDNATTYQQSWQPLISGNQESRTVKGLQGGKTYYVAVEAVDEVGLQASLSDTDKNSALVKEDTEPPAAITDLFASTGGNEGELVLTWTAPGNDGTTGRASEYDVRYSTVQIANDADFNLANRVSNVPSPQPAGTKETLSVKELAGNVTYYFRIKTVDMSGNWSALSNQGSAKTKAIKDIFSYGDWWVKTAVSYDPVDMDTYIWEGGNWKFKGRYSELQIWNFIPGYGFVQTIAIRGSGYLRSCPPSFEWGTSFKLTAYYNGNTFYHTMKIKELRIRIDPDDSSILMFTQGGAYDDPDSPHLYTDDLTIRCYPAAPKRVNMRVAYTLKANQDITINSAKQLGHEGFRVAQFSSMHIDDTTHDANQSEYLDSEGVWRIEELPDSKTTSSGLFLVSPAMLGSHSLYLVHTDDRPRNTPTTEILLKSPSYWQITPQGYVTRNAEGKADWDDIGLWVNWDEPSGVYNAGSSIGFMDYYLNTYENGLRSEDYAETGIATVPVSATKTP